MGSSTTTTNSNFPVFSKSYVFDPRPHLPFRISAKRYWTHSDLEECTNASSNPDDDNSNRAEMLTLVFAHANGFHKEHWEPIIHRLFEQQWASEQCPFRIQDVWALDAPNHGDAAVMNEQVLAWGYTLFSWEDYARCVHAFLAGLGSGVDVDFSKRNLVAVGHSMGATAVILSTTFFPSIKFTSIHLIEPAILGNYGDFVSRLIDGAENRRDIWKSIDDAYVALKSRSTWQNWDDRILRIYVEHGLRPLPTTEYPDRKDGVTLKCTRKQEAATFRDQRSCTVAYRLLPHILRKTPAHITYGEIADFLLDEWRHDVLNNASGGVRKFASVTFVPGAGHLVVQTKPDEIANIIWKSLLHTHSHGQIRSAAASARL